MPYVVGLIRRELQGRLLAQASVHVRAVDSRVRVLLHGPVRLRASLVLGRVILVA